MMNKLGLSLGGGSGKGVVHLGVIKCLEEEKIKPGIITGTSIGALVGALYAYGYSFKEIEEIARKLIDSEEFNELGFEFFSEHKKGHLLKRLNSYIRERLTYAKLAVTPYLTERKALKKIIDGIFPDVRIEDLPSKFACITLDIVSGNDVILTEGSLKEAVMKAVSIAGIFPPWKENGKILVDGGPTSSVPVNAAKSLGAEKVIAVSLSHKLSGDYDINSALSTNFRVDEIAKYRLNRIQAEKADIEIKPNVQSIHWSDFSKIDYGINEGYRATREKIKEIKKLTKRSLLNRIKNSLFKI